PGRVGRVLEVGILDRKAECERSVDHRGREPVAVHVLEAELRGAGAEAVVLDAGATDGAQALRRFARHRHPSTADDAVFADPDRLAVAVDDPRAACSLGPRQSGLPHVGRYRVEVQMVVAGVDSRLRADGRHSASPCFAKSSRTSPAGGPAVVPPSTGITMPVICAARSLARNTTALATSFGDAIRCSGCIRRTIADW